MNDARELMHLLAEQEDLDTDGMLEVLVAFYRDSDLVAEAMKVLCDWMDEEGFAEELTNWMQGRGVNVQQVDEEVE
mgnify:CR=1 FL=1